MAEKQLESNRLVVVQGHNHPMLMSSSLTAKDIHWISGEAPDLPFSCLARCRHRQPLQPCSVTRDEDGLHVHFDQLQRAVTPGQSVVFYHDDACLGGGTITSAS